VKNIAVLGDDGDIHPIATGGGSGHVIPPYVVTPLKGIAARVGSGVNVTYASTNDVNHAVQLAKAADVAIVFVATESSEGGDRASLSLGDAQDNLVAAVANAQSRTVVVAHNPGAVLMPWANSVAAIVAAFYPGQEDGNAIASVLFGDVNPSGKLPITFPVEQSQIPVNTPEQYPGVNKEGQYSEKLLVGYRWYDAKNVQPLFPFGHGLSYTAFSYSNLKISGNVNSTITVNADVKNSGQVPGAEVAQLYIGFPQSAGEPPKQLKGFRKVLLQPGQTQTLSFLLQAQNLSIWDVTVHNWKLVRGTFGVFVGSSSRDLRLQGSFTV
jgi:beta-glucosidase